MMGRVLALAEAALALSAARLALRILPFRWLAPSAIQPDGIPPAAPSRNPRIARVAWAVERAAVRLPWHSTCLVRALAGRLMLARRGVSSVLCLGVTKEDGTIAAHAWLLAGGGAVCGGREAPGYTAIAAFPTERVS